MVHSSDEFGELTLTELLEEGGRSDSCLNGGLFAKVFVKYGVLCEELTKKLSHLLL